MSELQSRMHTLQMQMAQQTGWGGPGGPAAAAGAPDGSAANASMLPVTPHTVPQVIFTSMKILGLHRIVNLPDNRIPDFWPSSLPFILPDNWLNLRFIY